MAIQSLLLFGGVIIAGLYALLLAAAVALEQRLVYHPDIAYVTPQSVGLTDVEEKVLLTPDGSRVLAWWAKPKPANPTILYFHGNAGSLAIRAERVRKFNAAGQGMFMMTYRGFGGSTGEPSERANLADALLAYDTLTGLGVTPEDIIVFGESIGTGIAVQVAAARKVGGIILDSAYTSLVDVAKLRHPYLFPSLIMRNRYESMKYIGRLSAPALVLHGELDDIVPVSMGRKIFEALPGPRKMVTFPEAHHGDHYLYGSFDVVQAWIAQWRNAQVGGSR